MQGTTHELEDRASAVEGESDAGCCVCECGEFSVRSRATGVPKLKVFSDQVMVES